MDCPQCNRHLRDDASRCPCGWVVPKQSKLHRACAYIPCEADAAISVSNRHGTLNVCQDHYARWVRDGAENGPDPQFWETSARAVARRFGVDENLSPRDRCIAIAKATGAKRALRQMAIDARRREPGDDDEELAA